MKSITLLLLAGLCLAAGLVTTPDEPVQDAKLGGIAWGDELLVQVAVTDLDAACRFYGKVLELKQEARSEPLKWAQFVLPSGARLGVGQADTVSGSGTTSINISVKDIDVARRVLEQRGVTFDGPTQLIPGVVRLADFADPDGNRLRLAGAPR